MSFLADHASLLVSACGVAIALATYIGARLRDWNAAKEKAKEAQKLAEEEEARVLERAEAKGRADALRAVREAEHAELLTLLGTARTVLGHPEAMAEWQENVNRRLSALDGEGISVTQMKPVTPPSSSSVKTASSTPPRRR